MDIDFARACEGRQKIMDDTMKVKISGTIYGPKKQIDLTVSAMDLDSEEELLICAGFQGGISVIQADSLKCQKLRAKVNKSTKEHRGINRVQWCCIDSRMFLTSTIDNQLTMWDSQKMTVIRSKKFVKKNALNFHWNQFHATNPMVAMADATKNVQIVDFRVGWEICQDIRADERVSHVRWFPSGRHLLYTSDLAGFISVYDVRSARQTLLREKVSSNPLQSLRLTSDGLSIISIDNQSNLMYLDSVSLKEKCSHRPEDAKFPKYFEFFENSTSTPYVLWSTGGIDLKMTRLTETTMETRSLKGQLNKPTCATFLTRYNELIIGCTTFPLVVWSNVDYQEEWKKDSWSDDE